MEAHLHTGEAIPGAVSVHWTVARRIALLLIAACLSWLYAPIVRTLFLDCWNDENYSHGILVPIVVAWLVVRRRRGAAPGGVAPWRNCVAWSLAAAGGALLVLGSAAAEQFTIRMSGVALAIGLTGVLGGPAALSRYALPLGLLVCMVPVPYVIYYKASFPLQLFSARIAASTLDAAGFEVVRWGNIFKVEGHALEVVHACSGLRSMMTLAALSATVAVAARMHWFRGALLVAASIPVAMLGNSVRLVGTALLVVAFGPSAAEGAAHTAVGLVGFAASLGVLAAIWLVLGRGHAAKPRAASASLPNPPLRNLRTWICAATLLALSAYTSVLRTQPEAGNDRAELDAFPLQLQNFVGIELSLSSRVLEQVGVTDYLFRNYRADVGPDVGLYVGYYGRQKQGAQIHSPLHCYPGAGWKIQESAPLQVRATGGRIQELRRLVVERAGHRSVVIYWYDTRTGRLSNDIGLKLHLMRTALQRLPQDAALVRWSTEVAQGEDVEAATLRLLRLTAVALPHLERALPFEG